MPLSRTKRLIAVGATAAAATIGVAGIVGFTKADAVKKEVSSQSDEKAGDETPSYTSSVTAPEQNGRSEADEAAALRSLAKISPDQARDAALAAVPGTAGEVELENENGNVVYGVEITDASGAKFDVKVDAGNGSVLHQERDDDAHEAETPGGREASQSPGN
jgi:uncharacterized membrane protein YkoI